MSYLDYDKMTQALQSSGTKLLQPLSTHLITNIRLLIMVLLLLVQMLRPHTGRYQWNRDAEGAGLVGVFDTATGQLYLTDKRGTFFVDLAHEKRVASQPVSPPSGIRTPWRQQSDGLFDFSTPLGTSTQQAVTPDGPPTNVLDAPASALTGPDDNGKGYHE